MNVKGTAAQGDALLLTMEDAAAALGVGRSTVYDLTRRGEIKSVTIGRSRRIARNELERYVKQLSQPA